MKKKFYHYTPQIRLKEIIQSGEIKLASKSVYSKKEKPVAWVSTNDFWEKTATKMIMENGRPKLLTFQEQLEKLGCARIEVIGTHLMTWAKLKHKANMDVFASQKFEEAGIKSGANPSEWYGSLESIKKSNWIKAEIYTHGKWVLFENFDL